MEIEKINIQSFELWKLKMEYILVDRELWVLVDLGTKPIGMLKQDQENMERNVKRTIWLNLSDLLLLNIYGKKSWDKLGNLYYLVMGPALTKDRCWD